MRLIHVIAVFVMGASGCWRPSAVGYWTDNAYYPARGHYRIFDTGEDRLLLPGWTASAFAREDGRPTVALGTRSSHTRVVDYDPAATGRPERHVEERSDLSLMHADGSRIEAWTEPLDEREAHFDLGELAVTLATLSARDHPLDLTVMEHARATVDGLEGHQVLFELRDSQPVAVGIGLSPVRHVLVVVRPTRLWVPGSSSTEEGVPMLVFVLLSAETQVFDAHYAEFAELLGRFDFR